MEEEESELIFIDLAELSGTVSLHGATVSIQVSRKEALA